MSGTFNEFWHAAAPMAPARGARGEIWKLVIGDRHRLMSHLPLVATCTVQRACDYRWFAVEHDGVHVAGVECWVGGTRAQSLVATYDPQRLPGDAAVALTGRNPVHVPGVDRFTLRLWWWPLGADELTEEEMQQRWPTP